MRLERSNVGLWYEWGFSGCGEKWQLAGAAQLDRVNSCRRRFYFYEADERVSKSSGLAVRAVDGGGRGALFLRFGCGESVLRGGSVFGAAGGGGGDTVRGAAAAVRGDCGFSVAQRER